MSIFATAALVLAGWTTPAPITTLSTTKSNVALVYDSGASQVVSAWSNATGAESSFYNEQTSSWSSTPQTIVVSPSPSEVSLAYDSTLAEVVATILFGGGEGGSPAASTLNSYFYSGTWSGPILINDSTRRAPASLAYQETQNKLIAAWAAFSDIVQYGLYSGSAWSDANISTLSVTSPVSMAYDARSGEVFAMWTTSIGLRLPQEFVIAYSIYPNTNISPTWSPAAEISGTNGYDPTLAYNSGTQTMFSAWAINNSPHTPLYSIYNGSSWSNPVPISALGSVYNAVNLVYDSVGGEMVATWVDYNTLIPQYSLLPDGATSWTTPAPIPGALPALDSVSLSYNPVTGEVFAAWGDSASGNPFFSIFTATPILPVTGLAGFQRRNQLPLQSEIYNTISWVPSVSTGIVEYFLFRNGVQISTLGPNATSYVDHNQPRESVTYSVVAVNAEGQTSTPASVTIN